MMKLFLSKVAMLACACALSGCGALFAYGAQTSVDKANEEFVQKEEGYAVQMCECTDHDCAMGVFETRKEWADTDEHSNGWVEASKQNRFKERLEAANDKFIGCMKTSGSHSSAR